MTKSPLSGDGTFIDMYQLLGFDPADAWSLKYKALYLANCTKKQQQKFQGSIITAYHYLDCWNLELQTDNRLKDIVESVSGFPVDLRSALDIFERVNSIGNDS